MSSPTDDQIRTRAHQLWELAGKPEGRDDEFWHEAERELKDGATNQPGREVPNLPRVTVRPAEREIAMRCSLKFLALGAIAISHGSQAVSLGEFNPHNRVLVISAPAGDAAAEEQRRIYRSAAHGMAERDIVLAEAEDDSERSRQIRSRVSADGKHFQVFLVGKGRAHSALVRKAVDGRLSLREGRCHAYAPRRDAAVTVDGASCARQRSGI
ncbi:DUF2934 domain-containing protein [Bradyrhizobium sp.]|uniref:DUF2934 domain-containing protein n=1 Tax=Bradyrhizobium sp. TaxID=376 RepID=UPI003F8D12FF